MGWPNSAMNVAIPGIHTYRRVYVSSRMLSWIYLLAAIGLDIVGAIAMKYSNGCTVPGPTALMILAFLLSPVALAGAVRTMEMSLAYALWAGAGTAVTVTLCVWLFDESFSALKAASILLILIGVVGLSMAEK